MNDLNLCLLYNQTKNDEYFNILYNRYRKNIHKHAYKWYRYYGVYDTKLGFEDMLQEILLLFLKSIIYVQENKIKIKENFKFLFIFNNIVRSYLFAKIKKQKRNSIHFETLIENLHGDNRYSPSYIFRNKNFEENISNFVFSLPTIEQEIFKDMKKNKKISEIAKNNNCTIQNIYYYRNKLKKEIINYLKK